MNESRARREIVQAAARLLADGLGPRGSLSVRLDEHTMAVTPAGVSLAGVSEDMVVLADLDTDVWAGPYRPTAERRLHREVHRHRPDAVAVVHTHQPVASICAAARIDVPTSRGLVACAPHRVRGRRAADAAVQALGGHEAVLLANHGLLVAGAQVDSAVAAAAELERAFVEFVDQRRPRESHHPPAPLGEAWDPGWVAPVALRDGTKGWMSTAPYTLRFSALRRRLPAVLDDLAELVGRGAPTVSRLPRRRSRPVAVLVAGEGALVQGPDHEWAAMVVERAASAWMWASGLGGAVSLPAWEAALLHVLHSRSGGAFDLG